MAMKRTTRNATRFPIATMLVMVLAITTGWMQPATSIDGAAGQGEGATTSGLNQAAPGRSRIGADRHAAPERASVQVLAEYLVAIRALDASARELFHARLIAAMEPVEVIAPKAKPAKATPKPAKATPTTVKATPKAAATYAGTNHFWFPALGISKKVYTFECTRARAPDNYVYRWGCAGTNNVYLLGHAYGVFKPLHDAYNAGRLKIGMTAIYANSAGHVQKYRITEWRVVEPGNAAWAIASQPVDSMTLQTCVGPNGTLRLNVRLVAVD